MDNVKLAIEVGQPVINWENMFSVFSHTKIQSIIKIHCPNSWINYLLFIQDTGEANTLSAVEINGLLFTCVPVFFSCLKGIWMKRRWFNYFSEKLSHLLLFNYDAPIMSQVWLTLLTLIGVEILRFHIGHTFHSLNQNLRCNRSIIITKWQTR